MTSRRFAFFSRPALCLGLALATLAPVAPAAEPSAPAGSASPLTTAATQTLSAPQLYQFLLAEIAAGRGQYGLSAQLYIELAQHTGDPRVARRAAELAMYARDPQHMHEAARLWAAADPDSADARRLLDKLGEASANLEQVQLQLARALAQSHERLPANLLGLNRTLAVIEDKAAALQIIERLTDPYLEHPEAHAARAQAALLADEAMIALGAINQALQQRPDWEPALLLKAQILQHSGASNEAARQLADALARQPDNDRLRLNLARALVSAQRLEDARSEFSRLLAANPDDAELLYAVGLLSAQLKDNEVARANLEQALAAGHPQPDLVRLQLGQLAEQEGASALARSWFGQVEAGRYHSEAVIRSALSLAGEGEVAAALARLRLEQEANGEDHHFLLAQAQILRQARRLPEAHALLAEALAQQPDDTTLLYELALLAERLGQDDEMEAHLRRVLSLEPEHAHALNALGYAFADRGIRLDEAAALLEQALALAPDDAFILDSVGWLHYRRGELEQALAHLQRAHALRQDSEIAAHLGEVLWQLGRRDEARALLEAALRDDPDSEALQDSLQRLQAQ